MIAGQIVVETAGADIGGSADSRSPQGRPGSATDGQPTRQQTWPPIYRLGGKRALDLALVLLALPVVLPLLIVLALLVARDGHSPFFLQQRLGSDGRSFRIFKLRTMVPDAEGALKSILATDPVAAAEWRRKQKLRNDPRITPLGHVLRSTSLDELPQLLNVLLGHMSLVGPRPMMPAQRKLYPGTAYFRARPGITGLWQVADRNDNTFASRADFDARYVETMSVGLDLRTLARTVAVVFRRTGC